MKILVIGGAGFIGSNVVDELTINNCNVCIIDNLSTGKVNNLNRKAKFYQNDITNIDALKLIFQIEEPQIVYHFAAQTDVQASISNPVYDANINILGTINVLECCKQFGVKKIIYPSSAAVYGNPECLPINENHPINPISFYGISKYTPEYYIKTFCRLYEIKYTICRYSNVYGIRQTPKGEGEGGVVSVFVHKILNNESPIIFGDGEQTRDFVYVKDIAKANFLALNKADNRTINISTNVSVTLNELFHTIKSICNSSIGVIYKEARQGDILNSYLDNTLAKKLVGWIPEYKLSRGVRETINYYKNIYKETLNK